MPDTTNSITRTIDIGEVCALMEAAHIAPDSHTVRMSMLAANFVSPLLTAAETDRERQLIAETLLWFGQALSRSALGARSPEARGVCGAACDLTLHGAWHLLTGEKS